MTTSIVLLVLALGWVAYLAIWWKDSRKTAATRANTMSSFAGGMDSLGGSTARTTPMLGGRPTGLKPLSSVAAARRRQQIFTGLSGLAVLTLLGSFAIGPIALFAHVLTDCALGAYTYAVVHRRNLAAEREIKVQMLYPEGVTPLHEARRTVNA